MRVKKENIHFTKTQSTLKLSKNTLIVVKSIMNGILKLKVGGRKQKKKKLRILQRLLNKATKKCRIKYRIQAQSPTKTSYLWDKSTVEQRIKAEDTTHN